MTLLSGPLGKLSVGYISSYPEFIRLWFRSNSQRGRSGKMCTLPLRSAKQALQTVSVLLPEGESQEHIISYLDLKQHMGSLYLCVYVCHRSPGGPHNVCHRFPGGPRPPSGHHNSIALSPAVTFQLKSGSDPCSPCPGIVEDFRPTLGSRAGRGGCRFIPRGHACQTSQKVGSPEAQELG